MRHIKTEAEPFQRLPRPVKPATSLIVNIGGNDGLFRIQQMIERIGASGQCYFDKGANRNEMEIIFTNQQHYLAMFRIANEYISPSDSMYLFKNWSILQMAIMVKSVPGEEDADGLIKDTYEFEVNCSYPIQELIKLIATDYWDDWQKRDLAHQKHVSENQTAGAKVMARSMGRPTPGNYKLDRLIPNHGQESWCKRWETEDKMHLQQKEERKVTTMPQGTNREKFSNIYLRVQELEEQGRLDRRRRQIEEAEELQAREDAIRRRREGTPLERIIGQLVDRRNARRNADEGIGGSIASAVSTYYVTCEVALEAIYNTEVIFQDQEDLNAEVDIHDDNIGEDIAESDITNDSDSRASTIISGAAGAASEVRAAGGSIGSRRSRARRTSTRTSGRSAATTPATSIVEEDEPVLEAPTLQPVNNERSARPSDAAPPIQPIPESVRQQLAELAAVQEQAQRTNLSDATGLTDVNESNETVTAALNGMDTTPMHSTAGKGYKLICNDNESIELSRSGRTNLYPIPEDGREMICRCEEEGLLVCECNEARDFSMNMDNMPVVHPSDSISSVGRNNDSVADLDNTAEEESRVSIRFADNSTERIDPRRYDMMRRLASAVRGQNISNDGPSIGLFDDSNIQSAAESTVNSGASEASSSNKLRTTKSLVQLPTAPTAKKFQPRRPLSAVGTMKKKKTLPRPLVITTSTPQLKSTGPPTPLAEISQIGNGKKTPVTPKAKKKTAATVKKSSVQLTPGSHQDRLGTTKG